MSENEQIYLKIGKRVRHLRKLRKMSQEKLAELADINRNYVGKIERAESKASIDTLYKISLALKVELSCFFSSIK